MLVGCAGSAGLRNLDSADVVKLRPLLNSERMAHQFGSYGIELLSQTNDRRRSNLFSGSGAHQITRTLAVVDFLIPYDAEVAKVHRRIVGGASIGATFKNAGWQVSKEPFVGGRKPRRELSSADLQRMRIDADGPALAMLRYRLVVSKGSQRCAYAWITEIYHPDYLTIHDLRALLHPTTVRARS